MQGYANIILKKIVDNTNTNISVVTEFFSFDFLLDIIIQKKRNMDGNFRMSSKILNRNIEGVLHCVKSVRVRKYSGPYFPGEIRSSNFRYSVQMRENTDKNPSYAVLNFATEYSVDSAHHYFFELQKNEVQSVLV